ncbi:MAG: tricarballylate utilization protein TcuB, partial [Pseudomonadota bacterium]|nr:tricarballylate utilization protein TcuB [Pseudomonadota bacterium]
MRETEAIRDARRNMEICNACRYCEGFCAVFPAMELRREFGTADLSYLANLCHNCRGCYYACQYAPPHEWGVNVPHSLAQVRAESYEHYAWPPSLARLFQRNGVIVSLVTALALAAVLLLTTGLRSDSALYAPRG